jgi:coenzyme PQQ precursor peptide PqqA
MHLVDDAMFAVGMALPNEGAPCPLRHRNALEESMTWHTPKFIEVSCGMEINRYAPADGNEPVLF